MPHACRKRLLHRRGVFRNTVYDYYARHGRDLPWRRASEPYRILVSEIMLQQTQVSRVLTKYDLFLRHFPTVFALAKAPLYKVIAAWQGLGYNRRALALKRLAQAVVSHYAGKIPERLEELQLLPGIGKATAGAICAFAFNQPAVFIETNIRSVFIHHFFKGCAHVDDDELLPYVERELDRRNPRRWYSALMDYGVYLKEQNPNPSRKSSHYVKQSPFQGSDRQVRGQIIKILVARRSTSVNELSRLIGRKRFSLILAALQRDGLITQKGVRVSIRSL